VSISRLKLHKNDINIGLKVVVLGRQGWTQGQVADARHPERNPITHIAVGKHGKAAENGVNI
jgi:hypothetical protein